MKITSTGIVDGVISDKYGKRGDMTLSLPLEFTDYPNNTKSFAVILEDFDAIPVCGHCFIHWLVADLKKPYLEENASLLNHDFKEGKNHFNRFNYGGMAPPDKDHYYDITVYALDAILDLQNNFTREELIEKMQNHILDQANIKGLYRS